MKKGTNYKYIIILTCLVLLTACEKTLEDFEIKSAGKKVVIEAYITDSAAINYVRISQTGDFYDAERPAAIKDADVTVYENGNAITFSHQASGYYINPSFSGSPGNTYKLEVTAEGKTYTATETMPPARNLRIDSLVYTFEEQADDGQSYGESNYREDYIEENDSLYNVYMFAREPQDMTNFYKFEFFRNGSKWQNQSAVIVNNDEGIGEAINGLELPGYYLKGDTVSMNMYSMTENVFSYYEALSNVMNSDGGMFNPPPGNPANNISNGALGIFVVAAVTSKTTIIR